MNKKFVTILLSLIVCFVWESIVFADNANHHNTETTISEYNTYETSYNTYEYNTYNTNSPPVSPATSLQSLSSLQTRTLENVDLSTFASSEASTALDIDYTLSEPGIVDSVPSIPLPNVNTMPDKIFVHPALKILKLNPGEFATIKIDIKALGPISSPIHLVSSAGNTLQILTSTLTLDTTTYTSTAYVIVTLPKSTYWIDETINFTTGTGLILATTRIVCENRLSLDHVSRITTDTNYTTIGHGIRQTRGTWGWGAYIGVRHDRNDNSSSVFATMEIDW